jgi:hypothetical protein
MLTSLQGHLDELCFWSARDSTRGIGGVTWSSARHLADLLNVYGQRVQDEYSALLVSCDQFFAPLSDPLRCDLGLHAWLAPEREESYSKWLHWTLKQFAEHGTLGEILDLPIASASDTSGIELSSEWTIRSRDKKRSGRIDIMVFHGEVSAILEIKTKSFTDEALEKHLLYCESPDVPPEAARIFIAQNADGLDLRGFRLLDWKEICVRLRRRVKPLAHERGLLTAAMVIAFIAAVEQNILGVRPFTGQNYYDIPAAVTHLQEFLRRITLNET